MSDSAKSIIRVKSAIPLLDFLQEYSFSQIPDELWDKYLWLYGELLQPLAVAISDVDLSSFTMCTLQENTKTVGIAFGRLADTGLNVHIECIKESVINLFISELQRVNHPIVRINVRQKRLAQFIQRYYPQYKLIGSAKKYYTRKLPELNDDTCYIRELDANDVTLFDSMTFSNGSSGWPEFPSILEEGIRYFGFFVNDSLIAKAGLAKITAFRSEIIAVVTFEEKNRRKGYARTVCSYALKEGLKQSRICTWSCNVKNTGSRKTAESLGMTEYDSRYVFTRGDTKN